MILPLYRPKDAETSELRYSQATKNPAYRGVFALQRAKYYWVTTVIISEFPTFPDESYALAWSEYVFPFPAGTFHAQV